MKLDQLYLGTLGNSAGTKKYKRMADPKQAVMDPNSFIINTGSMISNKLSKKMKMVKSGEKYDVLWSPVALPAPHKLRHRQYMKLSY